MRSYGTELFLANFSYPFFFRVCSDITIPVGNETDARLLKFRGREFAESTPGDQ